MATATQNPAQFLSALLAAVRELTGRRPPPTWTHVDKVQHKLGTANRDAIDAAIRVAVALRTGARQSQRGAFLKSGDCPSRKKS